MATKNEILTLLKTIKQDYQNFGLSKIGLIGSYAKGTYKENSDIDIIFDVTDELDELSKSDDKCALAYLDMMCDIKNRVELKFNKSVDVVDTGGLQPLRVRELFVKDAIYA
ncbi:nucleotidyltransferase domain-containing protein [uncultured Campylobacter sp.]|uniref:nucleotidyltransferase family protein n=1 Tax=uncultured Campylobacter sp. TaxID=218934 RepID=UPI003211BB04